MHAVVTKWNGEERNGEGDVVCNREKYLIREQIYTIAVDGVRRGSASCTPRDLEELAAGWLYSEGYLTDAGQIRDIRVGTARQEIDVQTVPETDGRESWKQQTEHTEPSAQGRAAPTDTPNDMASAAGANAADVVWTSQLLQEAWMLTQTDPPLHEKTRGAHSCAILTLRQGRLQDTVEKTVQGDSGRGVPAGSAESLQLLWRSEDAGRHSALDKAIGWALLHDVDLGNCLLYTSGRISTRMAMKATAAGAGALAGKGTVTAEALQLARRHGMALIGYAGENAAVWFWDGATDAPTAEGKPDGR